MRIACGWFDVVVNRTRKNDQPGIALMLDASVSDSHVCQGRSMSVGQTITKAQAEELVATLLILLDGEW